MVNGPYTETLTHPAYPGQVFSLISSENGLYRLWSVLAPPGAQEVLTYSLAGWTVFPTAQDPIPNIPQVPAPSLNVLPGPGGGTGG